MYVVRRVCVCVQGVCVRLCAPLLLFGANLRTLRSGAGKLLPAFGLGAQ